MWGTNATVIMGFKCCLILTFNSLAKLVFSSRVHKWWWGVSWTFFKNDLACLPYVNTLIKVWTAKRYQSFLLQFLIFSSDSKNFSQIFLFLFTRCFFPLKFLCIYPWNITPTTRCCVERCFCLDTISSSR